jgi:AcrR family transcriptional regulator
LAESLKKLMKKKSLSKITISDIVKDCDVNRKTFYYHFIGIEELFKWMLEEEAVHVVKNFDVKKDHKEAILFVMDYIDNNQDIAPTTRSVEKGSRTSSTTISMR